MVGRIEGFTQELKSAWVLQQTNVQQALGLVAVADQAAERVANLEKQLQDAVQKWSQPLFEAGRMEQLEKLVVELHQKIVSQDQVFEGAQKSSGGLVNTTNPMVGAIGKIATNFGQPVDSHDLERA